MRRSVVVAALAVLACDKTLENTAPEVVAIGAPARLGTSDTVALPFTLFDREENSADVVVEYSVDGGVFAKVTAIPLGGSGTRGLATRILEFDASVQGFPHTFYWAPLAETPPVGISEPLRMRVTPSDGRAGASGTTSAFTLGALGF